MRYSSKIGCLPSLEQSNRYHLYIGLFCPFAHCVYLAWQLKSLGSILPVSIVKPYPKPWEFASVAKPFDGATIDHALGLSDLREIYEMSSPGDPGPFSVPVLFDTVRRTIVNNDSQEILEMILNGSFGESTGNEAHGILCAMKVMLKKDLGCLPSTQ